MAVTPASLPTIGKFDSSQGIWQLIVVVLSLLAGLAFIALMTVLMPLDSRAGIILFDHRTNTSPPYPFTVQNAEWMIFFLGLGAVLNRAGRAIANRKQVRMGLLPEADEIVLTPSKLGGYAEKIRKAPLSHKLYLHRLLLRVIWQFQGGKSVSQATEVMNSSLELFQHEVDISYSMLRYLTWLLPTVGFMGSVWGIAEALRALNSDSTDALLESFKPVVGNLGVAFYTTLLGLMLSAVLILIMHIVQESEERSINEAGQYCLDHLINKLYVQK